MENSHSINASVVLLLSFLAISLYRYVKLVFFLITKESDTIELLRRSNDTMMKNSEERKIHEIERKFYEEDIQDDIPPYVSPQKFIDTHLDDDEYEMVSDDEISEARQFYMENEFENNDQEIDDEECKRVIIDDENLKKSLGSQKNMPNYFESSAFNKTSNSEYFSILSQSRLHHDYGIL
jgi:hypothetical protein